MKPRKKQLGLGAVFIIIIATLVTLGTGSLAYYSYTSNKQSKKLKNEIKELKESVTNNNGEEVSEQETPQEVTPTPITQPQNVITYEEPKPQDPKKVPTYISYHNETLSCNESAKSAIESADKRVVDKDEAYVDCINKYKKYVQEEVDEISDTCVSACIPLTGGVDLECVHECMENSKKYIDEDNCDSNIPDEALDDLIDQYCID